MKHAAVKIVPKLLNFEQKQSCMDIAQEMLATFNDNQDLLKKVITVTLKTNPNHPNGSVQKSQDRQNCVNFDKM